MQYQQFVISNYRAIIGPLIINVQRDRLLPIIGINEAGKTTILHAVFAFDSYNDSLNDDGRHLKDTANLYRTASPQATIAAVIQAPPLELVECLDSLADDGHVTAAKALRRKRKHFPNTVTITRNVVTGRYRIDTWPLDGASNFANALSEEIIRRTPYILFFDDFRDSVDERIEITDPQQAPKGWLAILQQLFKRTDNSLSVYDLPKLEERQRKSVLAKVKKHLNATLTREWQNFRLDDSDALEISLEYEAEMTRGGEIPTPATTATAVSAPATTTVSTVVRHYVKLDVIEKDASGDEHYFFIRDRSKGFYWFFNFVMKLEFNPKVISDNDKTIYLLDEPGSYLHASAQAKLCAKLKQLAQRNLCYLLHPFALSA